MERLFLDSFARNTTSITTKSQWSSLKNSHVLNQFNGKGMLLKHSGSLLHLLQCAYPELSFKNTDRPHSSQHYWHSPSNRRYFVDFLAFEPLQFNVYEEFYNLTYRSFKRLGGSSLLHRFHWSLLEILSSLYREYPWNVLHFKAVTRHFYDNPHTQKATVNLLMTHFSIQQAQDWYRLSLLDIAQITGRRLNNVSSLSKLVLSGFPEEHWRVDRFSHRDKRSRQRVLLLKVRELFPLAEIIEEYVHPCLRRKTGLPLRFDLFLPTLNVAFEFNGEYHYLDIPMVGYPALERTMELDTEKTEICKQNNIQLIVVPYWWGNTREDLVELMW